MAKVFIFLANGFEEVEALGVVDLLRRAGIEIDMVSAGDDINVTGSHNIAVKADYRLKEINADEADMLVLPGGMPGTINLLHNTVIVDKIRQFHKEGKMLAAICAAPSVLGAYGVLNGKNAVCYPGYEEKLLGARVQYEKVVKDGNVITARGLGVVNDFALKIIEHFQGIESAEKIREAIIYNI